jgi:hypothetical protein
MVESVALPSAIALGASNRKTAGVALSSFLRLQKKSAAVGMMK